jgi:hypothetical protein
MHTKFYSEILQAITKNMQDVYKRKVRASVFGFSILSSESGNEHMAV